MRRIDIMEVGYRGYTIKVRWDFSSPMVHYHVWASHGGYFGFRYTIVDARKWIDAEEVSCED